MGVGTFVEAEVGFVEILKVELPMKDVAICSVNGELMLQVSYQ